MKEKLEKIRDLINELIESLGKQESPRVFTEQDPKEEVRHGGEFAVLKGLLESEAWPEAVPQFQIADEDSEKDKEERAAGIVDIMLPPVMGKKFLDFGCGEGHVAKYASNEASFATGYDVRSGGSLGWENRGERLLLTTDFEKVKSEGPYDLVLIYDVLDHASDPREVLFMAKSVLADGGSIHLRIHPWCGRHGGHLYRKLNKAFAHLVFRDDELESMGVKPEDVNKVVYPLNYYSEIIREAGLSSSEPEVDGQEVEGFFRENPLVRSRILKNFGIPEWQHDKPSFQMSQCFVDYILRK